MKLQNLLPKTRQELTMQTAYTLTRSSQNVSHSFSQKFASFHEKRQRAEKQRYQEPLCLQEPLRRIA
ncbi:MAG TPA: hypothetical protein VN457_00755 [Chlamydiales bacterium]|nr:hypothetical protein [Chlamydiales bacterium]